MPTDLRATTVTRLRAAGCVFAEEEAELLLAAATGPALETLVSRRVAGEPLEHLLGWAEFAGLRVLVDPGVFTPRRRTELLVEQAVAHGGAVVVDLCCGTGAVGLAVARALGHVQLTATDVEPAAVACARRNVKPIGGRVVAGDLYAALPVELRGRVDLLCVNAPYVPTAAIADMPPEARDHEPRVALDGGDDGLDLHRRVAAGAPGWLAPGGALLLETSRAQADRTAAFVHAAGLAARLVTDGSDGPDDDDADDDDRGGTVVVGVSGPGRAPTD